MKYLVSSEKKQQTVRFSGQLKTLSLAGWLNLTVSIPPCPKNKGELKRAGWQFVSRPAFTASTQLNSAVELVNSYGKHDNHCSSWEHQGIHPVKREKLILHYDKKPANNYNGMLVPVRTGVDLGWRNK